MLRRRYAGEASRRGSAIGLTKQTIKRYGLRPVSGATGSTSADGGPGARTTAAAPATAGKGVGACLAAQVLLTALHARRAVARVTAPYS